MHQEHYLLSEVARKVGKKPHQNAYLLTNRVIQEPELRIGGRRVFSPKEVERIQEVVLAMNRHENHEDDTKTAGPDMMKGAR